MARPLRVGVAGVLGRMGRVAAAAIDAAPDLELAAGLARSSAGGSLRAATGYGSEDARLVDDLDAFFGARLDVVIDVTVHPATVAVARGSLAAGASPVIGATGWTAEEVASLERAAAEAGVGALIVPNFALGAVLMMRYAEDAVRYLHAVEIIEMHHDRKRDAPSGTAALTARRLTAAGGPDPVPIHSVRLPGLVAHQAVIFGSPGETLTIRHDTVDREVYAEGIVLAARRVRTLGGLAVGLDAILDPSAGGRA